MKLPLAYYGDPILRKKAEKVSEITEEIRHLVRDMTDTLVEENGIGLAAPQVHHSLAIFITAVPIEQENGEWLPGQLRVFINPKILSVSEEKEKRAEGCLSIPKLYGEVERPQRVKIKATDIEGNSFVQEFSGLEARCILHENDHLNGVLFIDRIKGKERKEMESFLQQIKKTLSSKSHS